MKKLSGFGVHIPKKLDPEKKAKVTMFFKDEPGATEVEMSDELLRGLRKCLQELEFSIFGRVE